MYDADDLDGASHSPVDDEVVADGPEEDSELGEILPLVAHGGEARQVLKGVEDQSNQAVSRIGTFIGDIIPKVV
jgi:hypothetical protein